MKQIMNHVRRYRALLAGIVVLTILQVGSSLLSPTILASLVSNGILKQNQVVILQQGGLMLLTSTLDLVLSILVVRFIGKFSAGLSKDLRLSMFTKIQHFSTQDFQKFGTSSYINRTTRDIQSLAQTLGFSMSMVLMAPLMLIGSIILAVRMNFTLSLVLLGSIPFLGIVGALLVKAVSKDFTIMRQMTDTLTQIIRDSLTGIRVIRAFNKSEYEVERFDQVNEKYRKLIFGMYIKFSLIMPLMMITINFANLAVVLVGAHLIQASQLEVGALMAVIQYSVLVLIALLLLSFIFIMIPQGLVAAKRVNEVLEQENIQTFVTEDYGLEKIDTVEFKDVSFKYEGAEKAMLNNVDFTAKVGEKIAIIGSTGAGKSTLVNLLMRFLDTTTGELLMNGVNIREFTEKELREQIAFVPQNRMLFEGTIRDNLRFGNEHATDEEMIQALKQAEAWEFVSSLEEALQKFNYIKNKPIVIKPKSTNFGLGITIFKKGTSSVENYSKAMEFALKEDKDILIEEFIEGTEYRFFVIEGKTEAVLLRVPANVVGDGKHTIRGLVEQKNSDPLRGDAKKTPLKKIELGEIEKLQLSEQGLNFDSILAENEVAYLRENSNISTGGDSVDMTDEVHESYKQLAVEIAEAMMAKVCGVDLIISDIKEEVSN